MLTCCDFPMKNCVIWCKNFNLKNKFRNWILTPIPTACVSGVSRTPQSGEQVALCGGNRRQHWPTAQEGKAVTQWSKPGASVVCVDYVGIQVQSKCHFVVFIRWLNWEFEIADVLKTQANGLRWKHISGNVSQEMEAKWVEPLNHHNHT